MIQYILSALESFIGWLVGAFHAWSVAFCSSVFANWAGANPSPGWSEFGTLMSQANYFCPLSEAFAMGGALGALWLGVFLYRLIKSWIPTLG